MANEVMQEGIGPILAKEEATYGTDPTPDTTNGQLVQALSHDISEEPISRDDLIVPYGPGHASAAGLKTFDFACNTEVQAVTLSHADSKPLCHPMFVMCGLVHAAVTSPGTPLSTLKYTRRSFGHLGVTAWVYDSDAETGGGNGLVWKYSGLRGNGVLSWEPGQRLMFAVTAKAKTGTLADDANGPFAVVLDDVQDNEVRTPFVAHNVTVTTFQSDEGVPEAYGGCLLGGSIDLGFTVLEQRSIGPDGGVQRVRLKPGPVLATFQIEAVQDADWSPHTYRTNRTPLDAVLRFISTDDANDVLDITIKCQIETIGKSTVDGRDIWELGCKGLYQTAGTPLDDIVDLTFSTLA